MDQLVQQTELELGVADVGNCWNNTEIKSTREIHDVETARNLMIGGIADNGGEIEQYLDNVILDDQIENVL